MLKEYLGDPIKTNQVLINPPAWRHSLDVPSSPSKLYRSGDLVRYLPDGTIRFIGRKDTMVKLNGQRLEVGEVESAIRKSRGEAGSNTDNVAVDLVDLNASGPRLVAFLKYPDENLSEAKLSTLISQIRSHLISTLPGYMVPRIYIPLATFPHNSNGKLDRAKLKQHVRNLPTSELFRYTESGSSEQVLTEIPPHDTAAIQVSEILVDILRGPEANGEQEKHPLKGKNATLENLGLDSLRTVSLARSINGFYGLNIPIKTFRRVGLTVRDIAELVRSPDQAVAQFEQHAKGAADILHDIKKLDKELAQVQPSQQNRLQKGTRSQAAKRQVVFLTGATGFLGSQILRQLLTLETVSKAIALVRARDADAGFQRIVAAGTTARWWSPKLASRIEVWPGDLAKPQLGLSPDQWARLEGTGIQDSEAVTAIIHNGAVVNWASSYERLRATNVISTVQILKLALEGTGPLQHFTYVSGGEMHFSEIEMVTEANNSSRLLSASGYSQSKFASDVLVHRSMIRAPLGRRINMVKPGSIIGTATEGISSTDDFIWRLAAGVCEARAFVDGEQDAVIRLAGADYVAQRIIHACLNLGSASEALEMAEGISVGDFWRVVSEGTGLVLRAMDPDDWLRVVNTNVSRQGPSHPLWPVMEFVEQRKGRLGDAGARIAEGHHGKETREEVLQALRKSVDYLCNLRFLQGEAALNSERKDVFRRSAVNGVNGKVLAPTSM